MTGGIITKLITLMVSRNNGTQTTKAKIEGVGIVFTIQLMNFLRPLKNCQGA
jgi:hypothetical protein